MGAKGKIANYIPELAKADSKLLGIYVADIENNAYAAGDYDSPFTIQSISKIVTFMCALMDSDFEKYPKPLVWNLLQMGLIRLQA